MACRGSAGLINNWPTVGRAAAPPFLCRQHREWVRVLAPYPSPRWWICKPPPDTSPLRPRGD